MRFQLRTATGQVLEEGEGTAEMVGGTLVVSPAFGQPLRINPSDIVATSEPEPYVVRLTLAEGPVLELVQLGRLRTQVLALLADARGDDLARTYLLGGIGRPESFPGAVDDAPAELRLYDDALVVVPESGDGEKVPYPFIRTVRPDPSGYRLTLEVTGRAPLAVHRLARRTTEFTTLLGERCRAAAGRTSAFLGALLPGLGPVALRTVAGLLRDGLAGARTDLDAVDATIWPALIGAATLPDRAAGLSTVERLGPLSLGFKQLASVEVAAGGEANLRGPAVTPVTDHDGHAGSFGSGFAGMLGAAVVGSGPPRPGPRFGAGDPSAVPGMDPGALALGFAGAFGAYGPGLAYSMLATRVGPGSITGDARQAKPRAEAGQRGGLTAAHADHEALTVAGEEPTVLAFLLCHSDSGYLVYEVLNQADHATYVYRAADVPAAQAINRALDLVGFRVAGIYAGADSAGSEYRKAAQRLPALRVLREAYVGRVIHGDSWAARLAELTR